MGIAEVLKAQTSYHQQKDSFTIDFAHRSGYLWFLREMARWWAGEVA